MTVMSEALAELRAGTIDFTQFRRRTERDWGRLAAYLMRSIDLPDGIDEADVVQELLIAAWRFVHQWDRAHGTNTSLKSYVVWNACDKAKKWMHTQRKSATRDGTSPSRHPVSISSLHLEDWQEEALASVPAEVDALVEREHASLAVVDRIAQVATHMTPEERYVLGVFVDAGGDADEAAHDIWQDRGASRGLRLVSETAAKILVSTVVGRAKTIAASAASM